MSKFIYPSDDRIPGTEGAIAAYRHRFSTDHFIMLKNFVGPELLAAIQPIIETAEFESESYQDVGSEFRMVANMAQDALSLLAIDRNLLDFVQEISDCGPVNCFRGRIYKLIADPQHTFGWHNDLNDACRRVTMSINLSLGEYQGGELQIRETRSGKVVSEIANTGLGDAVLFPIFPEFEHRVLPVRGDRAKIAFSGWFKAEPGLDAPLPWLAAESARVSGR